MSFLPSILFQRIREEEERSDRVYEAVVAKVVDNKDPEHLARVKVVYPWMEDGDKDSSDWALLAALGAGLDRGWYFLPEPEDEVLVMFEHGDVRRPVVIGRLWNGEDDPPDKNDGHNERRVLVSRSGSKIELDDDKGTVTVTDGGNVGKIVISKEHGIAIEASQGDVCAQAPKGKLEIIAKEIAIDAEQNCNIESEQGTALGSDAGITVKAPTLQVHGAQIGQNSDSVQAPQAGNATVEEIPDPIGG